MRYVGAHLLGVALLLALFQSAGFLIERSVPVFGDVNRRTGLARMVLGMGAWMCLLFSLAALGLLDRPIVLAVGVLIGAAAVRPALRSRAAWMADSRRRWSSFRLWPAGRLLAWAAPAAVFGALLVAASTAAIGGDDDTYHLTVPKLWVAAGGFRPIPFNVYSNWPLNTELLYALAMLVQDYVLAKLVHTAYLGLLALAVYRFVARTSASWAGVVAVCLLFANSVLLFEATIANVDIAFAFFFFMAVVFAIDYLEHGAAPAVALSGVCCGCVAGAKLSGLAVVGCVAPLVWAGTLAHTTERRPRQLALDALRLCAPMIALALPWYVKSYAYTGNPLYPLLWDRFGGGEWSGALQEQFMHWQQSIGMGRSLHDYLALPVRVILDAGPGYGHFAGRFRINNLWLGLVPLAAVLSPVVPVARRCLLPAGLYFMFWAVSSQQMRFLIPVLPLLAAAAAVALAWIAGRLSHAIGEARGAARHARLRRGLAWAPGGAVAAAATVVLLLSGRVVLRAGASAARSLIQHPPVPGTWTPHAVYPFIHSHLPVSAKLLLLDTSRGFFLDREYIADSFPEASQINALLADAVGRAGVESVLRRVGVTHVVVGSEDVDVSYPPALWEYLRDGDAARPVYAAPDGRFSVYELQYR